jgi:hypothetical protein
MRSLCLEAIIIIIQTNETTKHQAALLFLRRKKYTVPRARRIHLPNAFVDTSPAPACWEFSIEKGSVETGVFVHSVLVWQCGIVVWVTTRTKKRAITTYVRNRRSPLTLSNVCRNLQVFGSTPLSDPGALTSTEAYPRILLIKPVNLQITKGWKIARDFRLMLYT